MKNLIFFFFSLSLIFGSCNNSDQSNSDTESRKAQVNPQNVVLIEMDVKGMTCTGCENTIKSGVLELDGVTEVEASHINAKTYVKVDTSLTSTEEISNKIRSKGYETEASVISRGEIPPGDDDMITP